LGPVVISLAAGGILLLAGLFVNGCRLNRLLSSSTADSLPSGGGGAAPLVVTPPAVRDSAIAGATAPRVTTLDVRNNGSWTASSGDDWIHVTPASGGAHASIRLSLDPKDLDAGMHSGSVTIAERATNGDTVTVPVSFRIQQPVLKVTPPSLSFTAHSSTDVFSDTLQVTNDGDGPLTWSVTTAHRSAWLTLGDTAGTAPGVIPLRVSSSGLSYFGTFTETIVVTAPGAKNSPQQIQVTLRHHHHDGG
jgi:Viral BACON domain